MQEYANAVREETAQLDPNEDLDSFAKLKHK